MTYFMKSGSTFTVAANDDVDIHDTLPVGTYTVKWDDNRGIFYLEAIDNFDVKGKIYGDTHKNVDRILNTFKDRPNQTGLMLTGEKGSGKTLLAKLLSIKAQKDGISTIVINNPWFGEVFNTFIQMIDQPVIVIFDEFEKVYNKENQEKVLTLFDGVYPSKKLFIVTCNDKYRINEHMRNRPGRFYYRFDYKGLDNDFIVEYAQDNLKNKEHIEALSRIGVAFLEFNFDMLKAMVEEMNRYNESPQEVMKVLNTKPEFNDGASFDVALQVNGTDIKVEWLDDAQWSGNPLVNHAQIYFMDKTSKKDKETWSTATFSPNDFTRVDPATGKFHYENVKGEKLALTKVKPPEYNWQAF